jgi:hypothetical protein
VFIPSQGKDLKKKKRWSGGSKRAYIPSKKDAKGGFTKQKFAPASLILPLRGESGNLGGLEGCGSGRRMI